MGYEPHQPHALAARPWAALAVGALVAGSSAVFAQAPSAPPTSAGATTLSGLLSLSRHPTTLSGVDVRAKAPCVLPRPHGEHEPPPRVVDSYPRDGQTIPPGVMILRVTYDQPMSSCPVMVLNDVHAGVVRLADKLAWETADRRTILFIVDVQPRQDYRLWMNTPWSFRTRLSFRRTIMSRYGTPAVPYLLDFSTTDGPPSVTAQDVLRADPGLAALLPQPAGR
ncbi:MAG TPA: hypothetical protein VK801_06270 [Caulobacteraceae bacterium]|nr:hypothetical protein [Caulobacteraceae bacterium]